MPKSSTKSVRSQKTARTTLQALDYYTDCSRQGMLYAALIRSPAASGIITNISIPQMPDGYFLFTARDIPGRNTVRTQNADTPVFCADRVSYFGEPIGIVAGPDESQVYELTSEIEVTFDSSTLESALESVAKKYTHPVIKLPDTEQKPDAKQILEITKAMNLDPSFVVQPPAAITAEPRIPSQSENTGAVIAQRIVKTGLFSDDAPNVYESVFKSADFDISETWVQDTEQPSWTETNGAFCFMENGIMNIFTPTQWPNYLRKAVSVSLNLDNEKIFIRETNSSGHDANGIWRNATLAIQTAVAAYLTGKPVKLTLSRDEHQKFMKSGVPAKIHYRTAVMKDGSITAVKADITIDVGSCNPFAQEILDRLVIAVCNIYDIPNICITAKAVTSTNPPTSIFPEMIDSQAFFAAENHLQLIAEETNILPADIRLKNICSNQKNIKMPFIFHTEKAESVLNNVIAMSDFNRKYTTFRIDAKQHRNSEDTFFALPIRGIGLTCAFDGSGYFGNDIFSGSQKIAVTLESDNAVTIHSLVPSPSISEIWIKTVSAILKLPPSAVKITPDMEINDVMPLPDNIYSNISIMTHLLTQCSLEIAKKREKTQLPLTVKKGLGPSMKKQWNKSDFRGIPFHTTSFGAAVVEIELDPYTYKERIKGIWLTVDCGRIFSLHAIENTLRLSIQQELSQLVADETIVCDGLHISFIQSEDNPGQIGEIVHNTVPAAFSSALSQALSARICSLPCTAETIYSQGDTA
ncbi:MAG: xanthine dehydrogenase family protein molybdopterin-binding subunit [Treponema sp.]|nr:xanthine dehydrogenase family protein molybdopterin-binding subunit [Treponema sp.]